MGGPHLHTPAGDDSSDRSPAGLFFLSAIYRLTEMGYNTYISFESPCNRLFALLYLVGIPEIEDHLPRTHSGMHP